MYKHRAPSTTSISDIEDDDVHSKSIFPDNDSRLPIVSPAQWSSKLRVVPYTHPSPHRSSPISVFPPEVLIHIFKHIHSARDLYSALRVSRSWCECSVELLWHKPTFSKFETLLKMTRLLSKVDQTFAYASFIRRLNFLALAKDIRDDVLLVLARCERIERLTLVNCDSITGGTLARVLPKFANLVAIDLSGVIHTNNLAISVLAGAAKRLQGINLAGCKNVSDEGVIALAKNCPLLRRVKLSGLAQLTDEPISALAKSCPLLLEIDLNHCALITDLSVRDIWTYSTHMREMRLSHCPALTDAGFPSPLKKDLQSDLPPPFPPTNPSLEQLPPLILNRSFEHLRMLDLTACSLVSDEAIEGIISHAPKIRNLVLSKCALLTDRSVENICRLGRHLHYLHLGHAVKITDRSVRTLSRSCTRLRYIDFANCALLTDMSVFELSSLPKLRRIGLVRVTNLTDEAIYALAERHATLERIHLSYCDQISVMAIHFLLQKLHKLTHLSLTGVPAFRQPELQQFCREPPNDFSSVQQQQFCVYSGRGVSQLRAFLAELFDHITEMNGTDDTEYEDEDTDAFNEDDGLEQEQDAQGEGEDDEYAESGRMDSDTRRYQQLQGFLASRPASDFRTIVFSQGGSDLQGLSPSRGASPSPGPSQVLTTPRPNGTRTNVPVNRTLADILPIVEYSHTHPVTDTAGQNDRNAAAFLPHLEEDGTYNIGMSSEVQFPDIGRGMPNSNTFQRQMMHNQEFSLTQSPQPMHVVGSVDLAQYSSTGIDNTPKSQPSSSSQAQGNLPSSVAWPYREPPSPAPDMQEVAEARGRSVRRSLRNTLNAAEQYATSLLFGKSPNRGPG